MDNPASELQGCAYRGRTYPHGAELCENNICKLCEGGEFEVPRELSTDEEDILADPGEAYFNQIC